MMIRNPRNIKIGKNSMYYLFTKKGIPFLLQLTSLEFKINNKIYKMSWLTSKKKNNLMSQ